jgi:predicted Rossmann fold nucleotide-binding protein DprA/Smf involved in DNA uptake
VDQAAQDAAIATGGKAIAILADSLVSRIRKREIREALNAKQLILLTAQHPESSFKVWSAMDRNKIIYAMSRYAVVVESSANTGGTWQGAIENLKAHWVPLFVRRAMLTGNQQLIQAGGLELDPTILQSELSLSNWLAAQIEQAATEEANTFSSQPQLLSTTPEVTPQSATSAINESSPAPNSQSVQLEVEESTKKKKTGSTGKFDKIKKSELATTEQLQLF